MVAIAARGVDSRGHDAELIGLAKDMREANARGEALGLTEEELAFLRRPWRRTTAP